VVCEYGPAAFKSANSRINGWTLVDIEAFDIGGYVEHAMAVVAE
jgi:hypothetical protein